MPKISGIYKITNDINGKVYIGQSIHAKKRLSEHRNALRNNHHNNKHLQSTWNKHGEENFELKILELCSEALLDKREIYWISYYKANNGLYGYNSEGGGRKNKIVSDEIREKLRISSTGRPHSLEGKKKIGDAQRGKTLSKETRTKVGLANIGNKNMLGKHQPESMKQKMREVSKGNKNMLGKHHSAESKRKMSESHKGKPSTRSIKVICLTTLKIFNCLGDGADFYKCGMSHISSCCTGMRKSCGTLQDGTKLVWQHYTDYIKQQNITNEVS